MLFPGRFALQYPLYDYPRIAELRTILERLELRDTLIFWEGRYFLASTWLDEEEKIGVQFRSRDNGIAITFRHDDWQAIKSLFRRGWQAPEVRRLWDALAIGATTAIPSWSRRKCASPRKTVTRS